MPVRGRHEKLYGTSLCSVYLLLGFFLIQRLPATLDIHERPEKKVEHLQIGSTAI